MLLVAIAAMPARAQPRERLTLVAGGDVVFARETPLGLRTVGGEDPFAGVAERLSAADLAFVNLESPICSVLPGDPSPHSPTDHHAPVRFGAPPGSAERLAAAGIDVVSAANNHALDCGRPGPAMSLAALSEAGVAAAGASIDGDAIEPVVIERAGARVGIWAVTVIRPADPGPPDTLPPIAAMDPDTAARLIPFLVGRARREGRVDLAVVSIHWGRELAAEPTDGQVELAHALVDGGVDLVLGHHPHVLQPIESYGEGLIAYSLGNLLFDMSQPETRSSALLEVAFEPGDGGEWQWTSLTVHPLSADPEDHRPLPATGDVARAIVFDLARRSEGRFGTRLFR